MSFYREAGGGGWGNVDACLIKHLINVNNCCYGRCYVKSCILLIRFLRLQFSYFKKVIHFFE